jgi:predicted lipoprotein with Yx(FWY)xxD motif
VHRLLLPHTARARLRRALALLLAPAAVAVVVAGCGGGGGSSAGAAAHGSGGGAPVSAATVDARRTSLGTILVDARGRTLYMFEKDKTAMSTCNGACAAIWPPLTTSGKPTAGSGVSAGRLATSKRSDGSTEVTYAGHPLYTYAGDTRPGDVSGQNVDQFGAEWYVVSPSGQVVHHG